MRHSYDLNRQHRGLPAFLALICVAQPLLDVLSYWTLSTSFGSTFTTLLRAVLLAGVMLYAIGLSDRKPVYFLALAACAALYAGHIFAIFQAKSSVTAGILVWDFANYMRVIQLPLFALAFITFLRKCDDGPDPLLKGLLAAFFLIALVEVLSAVTGTNPYTYANKEIGLIGWFSVTSSQSAILSMLFPLALCGAFRSKRFWLFALVSVVGFGELYLFATRLTYFAIFVVALGMLVTLAISREFTWKHALVIFLCAAICAVGFQASPMMENRRRVAVNENRKQEEINQLVAKGTEEFGPDGCMHLKYAYEEYMGGLVQRFGLEKVADVYHSSTDRNDVASVRTKKINYCRLLLNESPAVCRVFGLPFDEMTYDGEVYDVENDFHGIVFLYGWAGLGLLAAFILVFALAALKALVTNWKRYFTLEMGACGIACCVGLAHAYSTSGVLRRPNASFYLSIALALIWYLIYRSGSHAQKEN